MFFKIDVQRTDNYLCAVCDDRAVLVLNASDSFDPQVMTDRALSLCSLCATKVVADVSKLLELTTDIHDLPLEEFDFSVRTYNTLKRAGVNTGGELFAMVEDNTLQSIEHLKTTSVNEIIHKLEMVGFPIISM